MFRHVHLYSLGSLIFIIALFLSPITANHSLGESTNHIYNPQSDFVTQITNPAATDSSKLAENAITSPSAASFPFYDGFESGSLSSSWSTDTTNDGRVDVSASYPYTGTYSLLLDDSVSDSTYSYAAAILTIDLASQSDVELDFWWDEFGTDDSREGVFISADNGTNWHQIMNFSADPGGWRHQVIDLDAEAASAGITYNDHFQIKFQFYSNYSIANDDGYAFDEVRVRSKPTPVPASFPFYDGFESGALSDSWQIDFTNEGRVQVGTSYPYAGTYSLLLDDFRSDSIYSYADAILTIDLAGQSGVVLDFWWDEFGTDDSREGVFISADNGTNWYQIMNFSVDPGGWRHQIIDLDAETVTAGMTYNDHFQIMFQFYSNYSIANDDGYAFDEVRVRANAAPVLSWVGDDDYTKDGLHPEHGDPGDNYLYRIKYADPDGDPPGDVKVQIQKDDAAIPGSPFVISCGDEDYTNGVICSYTQSGLASGTDYSYFFVAQDDQGNSATPTTKMDAPDVDSAIFLPMVANLTAPPGSAPLLEEISNPDGDYKFTVSWSAVDRATSYTLEQDSDSAFSNPTAVSSGPETLTSITVRNTGTFYYRVKAVNPVGESAWSNTQSTVVTNEPPACPSAGVWRGTTNYGKSLNITVIDIPSCYVDSVVMYFGICGGYKTTFYKDTPIVNNHFYMGGEDNHVSGDFISSTEAEGKFYLSMDCPTFPPVWVYLEGTWNATYQP